jgi:hypothetical protein
MGVSVFEAGMLICFGASWPFAVYRTWRSKSCHAKSFVFLWLVLIGYGCGITHKILCSPDYVIFLYVFNALMVLVDIILSYKYRGNAEKGKTT